MRATGRFLKIYDWKRESLDGTFLAWVIEDDDWIRMLVGKIARDQGCKVRTFPNAVQVLRELDKKGPAALPDVVITDLRLPGIDGFAVVEAFLENGFPAGNVAMMSGFWTDEGVARAEGMGVKVLKKPFGMGDLVGWIEGCWDV